MSKKSFLDNTFLQYLTQMMDSSSSSSSSNSEEIKVNEWESIESVTRRLKGTSGEYNSPIINQSIGNFRMSSQEQIQRMSRVDEFDWLQLGPTCIPFGETDSPARVISSGRITAIVINPNNPEELYVGTSQGGVWKTTDNGRNWKATTDYCPSLAIGALVMDPKNPEILYAGTGEGNLIGAHNPDSYYGCGILRTKNGGDNWEILPQKENPFIGARFFKIVIDPIEPRIVYAATSKGVYRSLNQGQEWNLLPGHPPLDETFKVSTDLTIDPNNNQILYTAFWGNGIYKILDANAGNPNWIKINQGLPNSNTGRIALCISQSNSTILYTLMSTGTNFNDPSVVMYFYMSEDSGLTWTSIDFPIITINGEKWNFDKGNPRGIGNQGNYNLNITVDPEDSYTVYLSAIPLLKAIRNPRSKKWMFVDIGRNIHTDNHAFAFHPTDNMIIFTGNDGGIYKSNDGGITWDDTINEGLCITEFEFMDQHPDSDAIIMAGTQDNGTLQFRNSPAYYLCSGGDGGFVAIDPENPNVVYHASYGPTLQRSNDGGMFGLYENGGSWKPLTRYNKFGKYLFYTPHAFDQSNFNNIVVGTENIYVYDQSQNKWDVTDQNKWESTDPLELSSDELISAINYVNSGLIYAGTTAGNMFVIKRTNCNWESTKLKSLDISLPDQYIWDIATFREDDGNEKNNNTVIVALGGFNPDKHSSHVWIGRILDDDKTVEWKNISGKTDSTSDINVLTLPNCPANAITIDSCDPGTIFVGTDLGVFRTIDGGESWTRFGKGLPNCAVLDMRILYYKHNHNFMRLLRVVTHGRGMWELELDQRKNKNKVDLYVRDHIMDTGRFVPSLSGNIKSSFEDPLRNIKYIDEFKLKFDNNFDYLYWWMCADIKVDPPFYQMDIDSVDYVKFEYRIRNRNPIAGKKNRIFVQIHNRGVRNARDATIKLFYAKVMEIVENDSTKPLAPKIPDIPPNFWSDFHNDGHILGAWKQIGEKISLPMKPKTLTNVEPTVVCWEWDTPNELWRKVQPFTNYPIGYQVALLVVVDSIEDPIPEENKIFEIEKLVRIEKHVGVRLFDVNN